MNLLISKARMDIIIGSNMTNQEKELCRVDEQPKKLEFLGREYQVSSIERFANGDVKVSLMPLNVAKFPDDSVKHPENPKWNGADWPPVGGECEVLWNNDTDPQWYSWKTLGYSHFGVAASVGDMGVMWFGHGGDRELPDRFMVTRTEEEKAIEKINEVLSRSHPDDRAKALYQEGYRKMTGCPA